MQTANTAGRAAPRCGSQRMHAVQAVAARTKLVTSAEKYATNQLERPRGQNLTTQAVRAHNNPYFVLSSVVTALRPGMLDEKRIWENNLFSLSSDHHRRPGRSVPKSADLCAGQS